MGTSIQNLNELLGFDGTLQIPVYDPASGNNRRISLSNLIALAAASASKSTGYASKILAPTATGFTVDMAPAINAMNVFQMITPTAGFASGTLKYPLTANAVHDQRIHVFTTQVITAVTHSLDTASGLGLPATLAANGYFMARYDQTLNIWHRVG